MTGDDFADTGTSRYRLPLAVTGVLGLLGVALVAGRTTFGSGSLTGAQLLAAPDGWLEFVRSYLTAVPGTNAVAGPPWTALTGVFSLVALGRPEWLVTATLVIAVPLAWLMAFRLLRQVVADRRLAGLGALAYALAPALVGGLNVGAFGLAATSILLPILGYSLMLWLGGRPVELAPGRRGRLLARAGVIARPAGLAGGSRRSDPDRAARPPHRSTDPVGWWCWPPPACS